MELIRDLVLIFFGLPVAVSSDWIVVKYPWHAITVPIIIMGIIIVQIVFNNRTVEGSYEEYAVDKY